MVIEIWGCYANMADGARIDPIMRMPDAYYVFAQCETTCHKLMYVVSDVELNHQRYLDYYWDFLYETIMDEFAKVHEELR